jgi:hypothetical protein
LCALQLIQLQPDQLTSSAHWRGLIALCILTTLIAGLLVVSVFAYDWLVTRTARVSVWIAAEPVRVWALAFIAFQVPVLLGLAIDRNAIFPHGSELLGIAGFLNVLGILLARHFYDRAEVQNEVRTVRTWTISDAWSVLGVGLAALLTSALIWLYTAPMAYGNFDSYRYFYASEGLLGREPLDFWWYTYPYPLIITATRIIGDTLISIAALQHLLRIGFAVLTFWLLKETHRAAALGSAVLIALSPLIAYQAHQLLDASLYSTFIGLIGLCAFLAAQRERQVKPSLLVGIGLLCAFVAAMRPLGQLLIVPTVLVVAVGARSWRRSAWIVVGFAVGALIMMLGNRQINGRLRLGTDDEAFYAFPTIYLGIYDPENGPVARAYQAMLDSGECDFTLPEVRGKIAEHWPHDLHNCAVRYNELHGTALSTKALYLEAIRAQPGTYLANFYEEARLFLTHSETGPIQSDRFQMQPYFVQSFSFEDGCAGERARWTDLETVDSWLDYTCTYRIQQRSPLARQLEASYPAMVTAMQPYRLEGEAVWSRFWAALALIAFTLIEGPKRLRALVVISVLFIAYHAAISVFAMFPQPRYVYFTAPFFLILVAVMLLTVWQGIRALRSRVEQSIVLGVVAVLPILPALLDPLWVDTMWLVRYYDNPRFEGQPVLVQEDDVITQEWGDGAGYLDGPQDHFSVRWVRTDVFQEGAYTFAMRHDDGTRIYLDGELIYENWEPGSHDWAAVQRDMRAGRHLLVVEYYEDTQTAFIQFGYYPTEQP